jgi:hypothetical protein
MKRFLVSTLIVCCITGALAFAPSGASAAVRHIRINHAPRPRLVTIEIRRGAPSATTPAACAGANCPPGPVQISLMQVSL